MLLHLCFMKKVTQQIFSVLLVLSYVSGLALGQMRMSSQEQVLLKIAKSLGQSLQSFHIPLLPFSSVDIAQHFSSSIIKQLIVEPLF